MKLQGGGKVKVKEVIYVPQEVKNILSISGLVSKGAMMGDTKDKITTKKCGINMTLYARKGIN